MSTRISDYVEQIPTMYRQGLFEVTTEQRHPIGTIRPLIDGRVFAYARAGASLARGKITVSTAAVANHTNIAVATAAAIGDRRVRVTLGATGAAENLYRDGWLHVNTAAGEGLAYKIRGHAAIAASGTGWIELYDKLRVALTTSSRVSLTRELQDGVVHHPAATATLSGAPAGVPPVDVTSGSFFWNQVKGRCPVLVRGTVVFGNIVVVDATATSGVEGAVVAAADHAALIKGGSVGTVMKVNSGGEYALINLAIPSY